MSLRRRPAEFETELRCDRCGHPAEWRHRVTSACCMVGEVLCEQCEYQRTSQLGRGSYWADLREDARWLVGQVGDMLGKLKWLPVKPGDDRLPSGQ